MSINTMRVTGNVGGDAELRYTQQGTAIGDFNLPVKQGYGENQKTSCINAVLWGKVAEAYAPNIKKGDLLVVSGEFYVEEWVSDSGKRLQPTIIVNQIQLAKKSGDKQGQAAPTQPKVTEPPVDFDNDLNIPF